MVGIGLAMDVAYENYILVQPNLTTPLNIEITNTSFIDCYAFIKLDIPTIKEPSILSFKLTGNW